MVIGITIFSIIAALLGYLRSKYFLNHITVMFTLWGIIVPLSSMGLYGVTIPGTHTYFVILTGLIGFFAGGMLWWGPQRIRFTLRRAGRERTAARKTNTDYELNKEFLYVLIVISLIYYIYKLYLIILLLRSGANFAYIRNLVTSEEENVMHSSRLILAVQTFIASPMAFLMIALMPIELQKKEKRDKLFIHLTIAMLVLWVVTTGGRSVILWFVLYFICVFTIRRSPEKKVEWKRLFRKYRFAIIAGAALLAVIFLRMTLSRKGADVNLLKEIYVYFVAPIPFFDHHLLNVDTNYIGVLGYGVSSFYGLIYPFLFIMRLVFGTYPNWISEIYYMSFQMLEKGYGIGGDIWMNAFATAFFQPYVDGRETGVLIIMIIFGAMCGRYFYKARYQNDKRALLIYLLLLQKVMFSMVRFYFTMQAQAMCFIYAYFALKPSAVNEGIPMNK